MMRCQRVVSPDFLDQISDVKPLRVGSGSTNSIKTPTQTQTHSLPAENPKSDRNDEQNKNNNHGCGELLVQWGQKKRSRKFIKIPRRAAVAGASKVAAAAASAMSPPCEIVRNHHRNGTVEGRSNGCCRSEGNSTSNGFGPGGPSPAKLDPKPPSREAGRVKLEWPRIYVTLSRKEKEDDFLAMKGCKLPHRPKKRAKNVEKALQYCYPGMWLSDLTRGRYEVREKKCAKKRRRGLKGMESVDSESE